MSNDSSKESSELKKSFDNAQVNIDIRKTNIFALYAKIFRLLFSTGLFGFLSDERRKTELEKLILPSNEEWRHRVYHRLVELQREKDIVEKMVETKRYTSRKKSQDWEWRPKKGQSLKGRKDDSRGIVAISNVISGSDGSMTEVYTETKWCINDILLAAKVLQDTSSPNYASEAEMRRVFGLVYDVLKYKNILKHALEDGGFWYRNNTLKQRERIVWLLLYDMQDRKFTRRHDESTLETWETVFKAVGLKDIEDALLKAKTHLAASISRLRIGSSAFSLDELLPMRLAEGINWNDEGTIVSGWVNTIKITSKGEFVNNMSKLNFKLCNDFYVAELNENDYVFDPICPKMINVHDKAREKLSDLVRDHRFVFLERSLCFGAAVLEQAIRIAHLCGPVVLTHPIAPRHTGYLAGLLADIEGFEKLFIFGTGDRRCEYEMYLKTLGITQQQCTIYSERYTSASVELDRATVVLATPPCSYTGVKNIIDLAVARGGDTSLLESLTDDTADEIKHPHALLADQFSTLKYALTRPNVQFLIYEVHTILPSETTEMIQRAVEYVNRMATDKYIEEHLLKRESFFEDNTEKIPKSDTSKQGQWRKQMEKQSPTRPTFSSNRNKEDKVPSVAATDIIVPDSDLFQVENIDQVYGMTDSNRIDTGCFIAVIRRKEITQFDSLFMIKVAESKGLFGQLDKEQNPRRKALILPTSNESQINRRDLKRVKVRMNRVAAPTYSSTLRFTNKRQLCPRHKRYIVRDKRLVLTQICETPKRDIRRKWQDAFFRATGANACEFSALRSDLGKPIHPFHIKKIALSERRPRVLV